MLILEVSKSDACLVPFDRRRLHELLQLGLNLIAKLLSDVAAKILLAEVNSAAQRALAGN